MHYELATLTVRFGTTPQAAAAIGHWVNAAEARGRLTGCWVSDIGALNQIVVLREFADAADLARERERGLLAASPFGCAEWLVALQMSSYAGFPWMPPMPAGALGPIYEIRTYEFKIGGLQPTLDLWKEALPARAAVSPCVVAMYALDGMPRFTQVWPYASLAERSKARTDAVKQGIWPPKGGPNHLSTSMQSGIYLPTGISPLQ